MIHHAVGWSCAPPKLSPVPWRHSQLPMAPLLKPLSAGFGRPAPLPPATSIMSPVRSPPAFSVRLPPEAGYQARARFCVPPSTNFS
ncbi:hypothetical protein D3C72_1260020 [compost metagenome]